MPTIHIPWAACPTLASQVECQKVEARLHLLYKGEEVIHVNPAGNVIISTASGNLTRTFKELRIDLQPRPPRK